MATAERGVATHPVTQYAQDVLAGDIVTGRLVRLACERHMRDLETAHERGWVFSAAKADRAISFFGLLRHYKGKWAGQPITLSPWQAFGIGSVFGWVDDAGLRRFRTAYWEVARKNGKSTKAGGIGLYMLVGDGEPGAEVYSAATKRDQAKIIFDAAASMARASPGLRKRLNIQKRAILLPDGSKFEPMSADDKTADGLNVHNALLDEYHAHRSRGLFDVLDTATGSRDQPLIVAITTAGNDRYSICWQHHSYSIQVLDGTFNDEAADRWFAYIAALDEDDDWQDPANWIKANPGLGVSVSLKDLEIKAKRAASIPASAASFQQKHLNMWVESAQRWISGDSWAKGAEPFDAEELDGRVCYGGLDLAKVHDLSAFALLFPPEGADERWKLLIKFYVPEENIDARAERDRVPYRKWCDEEFITATPGNTTDFRFIERDIKHAADRYDLREIAYDRWAASMLVNDLTEDGVATMVPFGQGFASMGAPTAEFERLVLGGQIQHGGNPVLTWNVGNTVTVRDPADNMKPDKSKSTERIDGVVAAIMALGRATVGEGDAAGVSEWSFMEMSL